MKVEKEETINIAFIMTADDIQRIIQLFDNFETPKISTTCADGVIREFPSVTELVQYENSPNKEIKALTIFASSRDFERRAYIKFSKGFKNIYISLKGEEGEVLDLMQALRERLVGTEAWYGFIAADKFSGLLISVVIQWMIVVPLTSIISKQFIKEAISFSTLWVIASVLVLTSIVSGFWKWVRNSYFPTEVFAIGQGAKRHKDKEVFRQVVIFGFLISVLSSIVVLVLYGT